jgi:hypothetical protein
MNARGSNGEPFRPGAARPAGRQKRTGVGQGGYVLCIAVAAIAAVVGWWLGIELASWSN